MRVAPVAVLVLAAAPLAAAPPEYRQVEIPGIPEQGFVNVYPADVNNHGVVVCAMDRLPGFVPVRAFRWPGSGPTVDLGDLGMYEFVQAIGINDAGQVIGNAEVPDPRDPLGHAIHGFFWENGTMTDLRPLGGDAESRAVVRQRAGRGARRLRSVLNKNHSMDIYLHKKEYEYTQITYCILKE